MNKNISKQKIILKKALLYKNFPVLKKVPYRTFLGMPAKLEGVPMFYTIYFSYKSLRIKKFVDLFLSSPRKYERLGIKGMIEFIKILRKIEDFYKKCWKNLSEEEKIATIFVLLHIYFASAREEGIYEIMIDCPPAGFNVESKIPKEKLKTLEKIKEKCAKEYEKVDLYWILQALMRDLKKVVLRNEKMVKKRYLKELKRIFGYKNFYELMQNSILQLLYEHPGIFRFKRPIPKIFIENIKYTASTKRYFIFPIKKERPGELKGIGVSLGKIKGKAKICHWVQEGLRKIKKGEILICPKTDPSWMPVLTKAIGIITESGGLLSHAAIVSRELKIPCVAGVKNALKILKDGDLIEINGKTGEIKILEKAK